MRVAYDYSSGILCQDTLTPDVPLSLGSSAIDLSYVSFVVRTLGFRSVTDDEGIVRRIRNTLKAARDLLIPEGPPSPRSLKYKAIA